MSRPKAVTICLFFVLLIELVVLVLACDRVYGRHESTDDIYPQVGDIITDEQIDAVTEQLHPQQETEYEIDIFDSDLYWLARIMQAEDGELWSDDDILKIGEVALNRAASPYFPNTVREVALQPSQYAPFEDYTGWDPEPHYIYLATRLLEGDRPIGDPDVVYQALFPQGTTIVDIVYDPWLCTTTYFCK